MRKQDISIYDQGLINAEIEASLSEDCKRNKPVELLEQPFSTKSLFVPKSNVSAQYTLKMTDWSNPDKAVLYRVIIAAYNYVFFDKEAAISAKGHFSTSVRPFIEWLNIHQINNRYEILKRYESERMDALGSHGGHSPLRQIMTVFNYAIESADLRAEISTDDYDFIRELRKTKISPNLNKSQKSLASYFGALDWLRREDIGVGKDLYSALASPKLTINSLRITAATVILELNKYKSALKLLVQRKQSELSPWIEIDYSSLLRNKKQETTGNILYHIISAYHEFDDRSESSIAALDVLLLSSSSNEQAYLLLLRALNSQDLCDELFLNKMENEKKVNTRFCKNNITVCNSGLFSWDVIRSLSHNEGQISTGVENKMFGWLMASLAVQPYDIPKLTSNSFRRMRIGGRVTQIECEYFKGRAKVFHTTRSLSTRGVEGQALLTYLETFPDGASLYYKSNFNIGSGINSIAGAIRLLFQCIGMRSALSSAHSKKNVPLTIPLMFCALVKNGTNPWNVIENARTVPLEERLELVRQSESPCSNKLFGLQAVKNSAVHAFSDPYTFNYLVNRNSHTNQTEKLSYLTENNEEWMNSAGRITREVMFDLIQNVFALEFNKDQKKQVAAFNSEFMVLSEDISHKCEEMNARLRIVTGQAQGKINEVGVLALSDKTDEDFLSPIYVLDSPLTVLRMHNYLHEFKKHYTKLLATNPNFLFKTVMPTVEWVEATLGKMSKRSQKVGRVQFDEMIRNGVVMSVFHSL